MQDPISLGRYPPTRRGVGSKLSMLTNNVPKIVFCIWWRIWSTFYMHFGLRKSPIYQGTIRGEEIRKTTATTEPFSQALEI